MYKATTLFLLFTTLIVFQSCSQSKNKIKMKKLIYIMDAHCGWCYGNSNNISNLENEFKNAYDFELLVGGMWTGSNAPKGGSSFNNFINTHSPQMEKATGAYVDQKFFDLTKDSSYTFSSLEPSCAIVLIKELSPEKTIAFAKAIQNTIFAEGKRLDKLDTYIPILKKLNIDIESFKSKWMSTDNLTKTQNEFLRAHQLANGFPTLVLKKDGQHKVLSSGFFNYKEIANILK